jgi:two-component system NtrC family sensor kinase
MTGGGPPLDRDVLRAFGPRRSSAIGLRNKVLARLLVLSLLPLLALSLYFRARFIDTLETNSRARLQGIAIGHRDAIDTFLAEKVALLTGLTGAGYLPLPPTREDLGRFLRLLQGVDPAILDVGVFDGSGRHVRYAGPVHGLEGRDYAHQDWFHALATSASPAYVSDVFLGYRGAPHFIVAVRTESAGAPWFVRITIDPVRFARMVSEVRQVEGAQAYLVNAAGRFQSAPPDVGRPLDPAPPLPDTASPDGAFESRAQSGAYLVAFARLRRAGWTLVVRQDLTAAYAPATRTRGAVVLIVGVGAVLLVLASVYATATLVRRVARSERDRARLVDQLVQAGKLSTLGEMAAAVAHEIHNPLAVILSEAGVMEDRLDPALAGEFDRAEFREHLAAIREEVLRCRGTTHKLLGFARRTEPAIAPRDIGRIARDAVDLIRREFALENIAIDLDLAPDLPPVPTDGEQVGQVLLNLLRNAADAIGRNGTITVATEARRDQVVLRVADTGVGIAPEDLEKVFLPFFTTKEVGKGTGLGLSISHAIVTSLGGTIRVASTLGGGTTFEVFLPLPATP